VVLDTETTGFDYLNDKDSLHWRPFVLVDKNIAVSQKFGTVFFKTGALTMQKPPKNFYGILKT